MIKDYYAAYEKKDWSLMEPILADGFTFTSPAGDDHINLSYTRKGAGQMPIRPKSLIWKRLLLMAMMPM